MHKLVFSMRITGVFSFAAETGEGGLCQMTSKKVQSSLTLMLALMMAVGIVVVAHKIDTRPSVKSPSVTPVPTVAVAPDVPTSDTTHRP